MWVDFSAVVVSGSVAVVVCIVETVVVVVVYCAEKFKQIILTFIT